MVSLHQSGWQYSKGIVIALVCLLELPFARAQRPEGQQAVTVLDKQEASRLILTRVPPKYPALARLNYIQGRVHMELVISPAGKVLSTHVLSGNPLLAEAALSAVSKWRYRPLGAVGRSTSFVTAVDIDFTLRLRKFEAFPSQAESDFSRQVKPPEVLRRPDQPASTYPPVRLRLLINAEGKVIDSLVLKGDPAETEEAQKSIEQWSFRPARWGALAVPWYLDVVVPVNHTPSGQAPARRAALKLSGRTTTP